MNTKFTKCLCIVSKNPNIEIIQYYKSFKLDFYLLTPITPDQKIEGVNYILDTEVLNYSQFNFEKTNRPGWYYQQFLKLAVVLKLPYDYVHIIDGDTYLEENAINSINKIYYSRKKINYCYCKFNLKFGLSIIQKNFIVNHMNFHKETLIAMFEEVFISWENILFNIDTDSWLSEYYSYSHKLGIVPKDLNKLQNKIILEENLKTNLQKELSDMKDELVKYRTDIKNMTIQKDYEIDNLKKQIETFAKSNDQNIQTNLFDKKITIDKIDGRPLPRKNHTTRSRLPTNGVSRRNTPV